MGPALTVEPGASLDRYDVVAVLGAGGMATVYEVRHRDLGTSHALKLLHRDSEGLRERLLFEGRAQARLAHPNVCRVSDVVRVGDTLGLVMDLVRGPSLEELLRVLSPNLLQLDWLADGVLRGVQAAHEAGVVHRDLKPANVLVDVTDGVVVPRVTDFGIARAVDGSHHSRATREGLAMGTPAFMAPEQHRDARSADQRSDVFSLGALLYELATGAPAFFGDTPFACYEATSAGRFRPIAEVAPQIPERVRDAITRALAPDPAARWQTVEALRAAWFRGAPAPQPTAFEASHLALLRRPDARPPTEPDSGGWPATLAPPLAPPEPPALVRPAPSWGAGRAAAAFGVVGLAGLASVAGLAAVALGLVAAAVWWGGGAPEATLATTHPPAVATGRPAAAQATAPPPATPAPPPATPAPPPTQPVQPPTQPVQPPAPKPVVQPAAPAPAPEAPAPPTTARVEVRGAPRALLVAGDQRLRPGDVPPGRWSLVVFFEEGRGTPVRDLTVAVGDVVTVTCDPVLRMCR